MDLTTAEDQKRSEGCRKWVGPVWKLDGETCVCKLRADHADGRFGADHECSCGSWFVDAIAKGGE